MICLFGSGETSTTGRKIHEGLFLRFGKTPITVAVLATPAGFQPNVDRVNREISHFFKKHLKNFKPRIGIIPAYYKEKKEDLFTVSGVSTDDEVGLSFLKKADYIFAGPGSPTYPDFLFIGKGDWTFFPIWP